MSRLWWQGLRLRLGVEGHERPIERVVEPVKRALLVLAHPDDEINLVGLVSRLRSAGAIVDLLVLTDGAANPWTDEAVVAGRSHFECRRAELLRSASLLGVRELALPEFPDSTLANHLEAAVEVVRLQLLARRPDLLVTFDSLGLNRHPDHVAAHQATREALARSGVEAALAMMLPPPPFSWALGAGFRSQTPPTVATLELTDDEHELKATVFEAHRSQRRTLRLLTAGLPPRPFFALFRSEWFLWLEPGEAQAWLAR